MPSSFQQVCPQSESRSQSPEVALSVTTSPSKLVKIACRFELEKNTAQAEARELWRKLANITNQEDDAEAPPPKRSRTNNNPDDNDSVTDEETQVVNASHRFVILYSLWLQLGKGTFKVDHDSELDEGERFENGDNKVQGQLQEIKGVLGAQLACEMSSEAWIAKVFMKGMKAQRSNTATHLRHHCPALFGVSDSDMLRASIRKDKFRGHIGWVDNSQGSGSYSSVDVEILHKNYSGSYDIKTAFLNPILMWVFVAIIRGPTAAKELMNGISSNPKTDTMARKHGIQHMTPGAIAGSVVLSRWALSSDDFLQSVGANTGINYGKDFEEYLEILMTGHRKKKKSILNVFREWDRVIFPNLDSSFVGQDHSMSNGLKTAMEMLEADEVEEDGPEEEYL